MVYAAMQYRNALKKELRCGNKAKKRLLAGFDQTLNIYLYENESPTFADLCAAFGSPEVMADILMAQVTPLEQKNYQRICTIKKICISILLVSFVIFTIWLFFFKEVGLTYTDGGDMIAPSTETTSLFNEGDEQP